MTSPTRKAACSSTPWRGSTERTMQMTDLTTEMHKRRWAFDMVVCSVAASGFYLYVVWQTRMFETTSLDPNKIVWDILLIILGYVLSVIAGHVLMKTEWKSFVWVSIVGSVLIALIRVGSALPGAIEYYYRFKPTESLLWYLIRPFGIIFLSLVTIVALSGVTLVASLIARLFISLFTRNRSAKDLPN